MGLPVIASIAGGLLGAFGSNKAAKQQAAIAQQQLALEREIYGDTVERQEPYYDTGLDYQNALRFELLGGERPVFGGDPLEINEINEIIPGRGIVKPDFYGRARDENQWIDDHRGRDWWPDTRVTRYQVGDQVFQNRADAEAFAADNPTGGTEYQGFQKTPGYQFALDQGMDAIENSAAARGNALSGATLRSGARFGQGLANQEYNTYLNRLTGGAATGQAAASNLANAGANFAAGSGNALANLGNAQSAGTIGGVNAINAGINNALGAWQFQKLLDTGQPKQGGGGFMDTVRGWL